MSLRGQNNGGFYSATPAGFDPTEDLSVFLWVRRGTTADASDRILGMYDADRFRGFTISTGNSALAGTTGTDIAIACGSGMNFQWGQNSAHNGRGLGVGGTISADQFTSFAAVIRGPSAADNTGSGGAQQIHALWTDGAEGAVTSSSSGVGTATAGQRVIYLGRDSASMYFDGWIAECAVWQGYRLTEADVAALNDGASPSTIAPDSIILHRSFRSGLAAEIGDAALTAVGTAPTIDTTANPPSLPSGAPATVSLSDGASTASALAPTVTRATTLTSGSAAAVAAATTPLIGRGVAFAIGEAAAATLAPSATVQFAKAVALGAAYSVAAPGALRFAAARAKRALLSIGLRLGI